MTRQQAIDALIAIDRASKTPADGDVIAPGTLGQPSLPNTADPSVFVEGTQTYVYSTTTFHHVPVSVLDNPDTPHYAGRPTEAMPATPAWARTPEIWAPTVAMIGGRYVMFFAAHRSNAPDPNNDLCVGRALASSPLGPFAPDPLPMYCGNDGVSGALDPSIFVDNNGNISLLMAMGGSNVNIWSVPLNTNAERTGPAVALLAREQPWQDWFIENPAMIFTGEVYLLAYSSGRWDTGSYMTGVARCATPTGPCTDHAAGPWLQSLGDRVGPGGLEFFRGPDGAARVAFHTYPAGAVGTVGQRSTHIRTLLTTRGPELG